MIPQLGVIVLPLLVNRENTLVETWWFWNHLTAPTQPNSWFREPSESQGFGCFVLFFFVWVFLFCFCVRFSILKRAFKIESSLVYLLV